MRKEYKIIPPNSPTACHYHIGWLAQHPAVAGFLEKPVEVVDGITHEVTCRMFGQPYNKTVLDCFDHLVELGATAIFLYSGYTVVEDMGEHGLQEILFLRFSPIK